MPGLFPSSPARAQRSQKCRSTRLAIGQCNRPTLSHQGNLLTQAAGCCSLQILRLRHSQSQNMFTIKFHAVVLTRGPLYRVTFAGRILATDTDVLNPTAGNQITMLTCIANEPAYRFCVIGQEMR